jgi:hypothetical protein
MPKKAESLIVVTFEPINTLTNSGVGLYDELSIIALVVEEVDPSK